MSAEDEKGGEARGHGTDCYRHKECSCPVPVLFEAACVLVDGCIARHALRDCPAARHPLHAGLCAYGTAWLDMVAIFAKVDSCAAGGMRLHHVG